MPIGSTAVVDATVIVDPAGAFVCAPTNPGAPFPSGSPAAECIESESGARSALFGPVLANRIEAGFTAVAPTGGAL